MTIKGDEGERWDDKGRKITRKVQEEQKQCRFPMGFYRNRVGKIV